MLDLATKKDMSALEGQLSTKADVAKVELRIAELKRDIAESKSDILKWVAGMFVAQTALIIAALFALVRLLPGVH